MPVIEDDCIRYLIFDDLFVTIVAIVQSLRVLRQSLGHFEYRCLVLPYIFSSPRPNFHTESMATVYEFRKYLRTYRNI